MLLSSFFSSSIDSSDGLARSIYELAQQSSVNFVIDSIPVSEGVRKFAKDNKLELSDLVFYGGEEYEIVATIPRSKIGKARAVAARSNIKLFEIGWAEKGEGVVYIINNGGPGKLNKKNDASKKRITLLNKGYDHFR
jgi:thiamine-monophosphate kinase